MTNSTFTKFSWHSLTKSRGVFTKLTWVFLMLFAFTSFKANATITVASFPDTLKHHSYCITSPQLILPVVATSNCSGGGSLAYQWYRGGATFAQSTAITTGGSPTFSGFTTSTMIVGTPAALLASDTFWVTLTETSGGCSQTVILGKIIFDRVDTKPVVSLVPSSPYNVCELDLASFTATQVSPTGYDLRTFDWYKIFLIS
jgi:hypothetical protein